MPLRQTRTVPSSPPEFKNFDPTSPDLSIILWGEALLPWEIKGSFSELITLLDDVETRFRPHVQDQF